MRNAGRLIVVGGHSRRVGKTTVVTTALAGLNAGEWLAVKISSHLHGASVGLHEETNPGAGSQAARYLEAGARKAFLLRAPDEQFATAAAEVRKMVAAGQNVIAESNRLVAWIHPDLVLFVTSPAISDWKPSSNLCLRSADALVITGEGGGEPDWARRTLEEKISALPRFHMDTKRQDVSALGAWIRHRLE